MRNIINLFLIHQGILKSNISTSRERESACNSERRQPAGRRKLNQWQWEQRWSMMCVLESVFHIPRAVDLSFFFRQLSWLFLVCLASSAKKGTFYFFNKDIGGVSWKWSSSYAFWKAWCMMKSSAWICIHIFMFITGVQQRRCPSCRK